MRNSSRVRACLFLLALLTAGLVGSSSDHSKSADNQIKILRRIDAPAAKYVPGEVLVRFKPHVSKQLIEFGHQAVGAQVVRSFELVNGLQLVRLAPDTPVEDATRTYRRNPDVLYAEPNYVVRAFDTPNDPQFPSLWGLQNTGQDGGTADADIDAPEAWSLTTGSNNVVVAVIDTGIDYTHPDLAANLFRNTADCNTNGVDDDGNGYVDDCYGIDATNPFTLDSDPFDDVGHGTHVAGTIGAVGNNNLGVVGVNWNVRLMPCKFLGPLGGDTAGAIACLDYVKKMKDRGVNIVATNNSWGGGFFSQALLDAIQSHLDRGILFIAAAGNEFNNNDLVPTYPANYFLPNIISVAATTRTDERATFSNFGRRTVHLGAPGQEVLSTIPADGYAFFSGTSMATPHVTGVAALLKAQDPSRDWRAIKNLILAGGDPVPALAQTITGRRLNANGGLTCAGSILKERLLPLSPVIPGSVGTPLSIMMLHINCAMPNGNLQATVSPTNQTITLVDDGIAPDQAAGDGIYSGQWTPPTIGSFTLSLPNGETVSVQVLQNHTVSPTALSYRNIAGTNLDLGDDSVVEIISPFDIPFGGGGFSTLFISSNGTISLTDPFLEYANRPIPVPDLPVNTLVAPLWDDLFPVAGTQQNVFVDTLGTAPNREFIVEWRNVRSFQCRSDGAATVRFQIVLFENSSDILFNYSDVTFGGDCAWQDRGGSATVGIQVAPDKGALWGFGEGNPVNLLNGQSVGDNTALRWELEDAPPPPNPVPVITSLSPPSATWGGPDFVLTVFGSNFVPESRVRFYINDRATTFISSTELRAVIPARDLTIINSVDVSVVNPAPGGGTSNHITYFVNNPVPTITSLDPSSALAGGLSFRLTVNGSGFTPFSTVRWNGANQLTIQYSSNKLVAAIEFGNLFSPGTAQITVLNSAPGGGISNAMPFPVLSPASGLPAGAPTGMPVSLVEPLFVGPEDKRPPKVNKVVPPLPKMPLRFLGWNFARQQGGDYLQHFSRLRARSPIPLENLSVDHPTTLRLRNQVQAAALAPGFPGLALREALPAGFLPTSTATGDFNKDGKQDWVVSNGGDNNLWLYLGRGDGTAELPRIIPLAGLAPVWVEAADLRGVGLLDLIVAEADSGTVGVLLGKGDGTFEHEQVYFLPAVPIFLRTGDFNGDSVTDVLAGLVADPQVGPVALLPGVGAGRFGQPRLSPQLSFAFFLSFWIDTSDLDGDGDLDFVVADLAPVSTEGVYSYLNDGQGVFKQAQYVLGGVSVSVALGDLNEDGCQDAVMLDTLGLARVQLGHCDGTFATVPESRIFGEGDVGVGIALADVNGDGHLDLVSSGVVLGVPPIFGWEAGNLLCVLLGDGAGNFSNVRVYRGEPSAFGLAVADLNSDGKVDVVTANQDSDSASVFLNDGQGGFGSPEGEYIGHHMGGNSEGTTNAPLDPLQLADVDNDGIKDLVMVQFDRLYPEPFPIAVVRGAGAGKFSQVIRSPGIEGTTLYSHSFVLGDFRNTGRPDFAGIGLLINGGSFIFVAPNNGGGTFGTPTRLQSQETLRALAMGDFNNDGKLDFVAGGHSSDLNQTHQVRVFSGNGAGGFTPLTPTNFGGSAIGRFVTDLFVADYNRDGRLDVVARVEDTVPLNNNLVLLRGNGDGTFTSPQVVLSQFQAIAVVDVNNDGFPDIIEEKGLPDIFAQRYAEYAVYIGQSNGTFQLTSASAPYANSPLFGSLTRRPAVADFNGDGNVDIAAFQVTPGIPSRAYVQFLVGNGDGTFTPTFDIFEFPRVLVPQYFQDADGDGRADLIPLNGFPSSFHIIKEDRAPSVQLRLVSDPVIGPVGRARVNLNVPSLSQTTVQLLASDPAIIVPPQLNIPAGSIAQEFEFTIGAGFDSLRPFFLEAQLGEDVARAYGTQVAPDPRIGFEVFGAPSFVTIQQGQTLSPFDFGVQSIGGYTTTVSLSCAGLPLGASCNFVSSMLSVPSSGFNGTQFAISASSCTLPGTYTVQVTASDGAISDSATLTLTVVGSNMNSPVPTLVSLAPASGVAGASGFTLVATGSGFGQCSVMRWNGSGRSTSFVSNTQLQALIPASDIAVGGTAQVTVLNPPPGGASNPLVFTVSNPIPTLALLVPDTIPAGSGGFTLQANGTGFMPTSVLRLNGSNRQTAPVNGSRLTAQIDANDLLNPGTRQITVFTPGPGGGTSNATTLTISLRNPLPTVTSLSPAGAVAGGPQFNMVVAGSNLVFNAVVRWNGSDRATTFLDSTRLRATIPASDVSSPTMASVTVFNPAPGGGTSNALAFNVAAAPNPAPTLTSIDSPEAVAGSVRTSLPLTVNGANFVNSSVVRWNGMNRTTNFVNSNQLIATIPSSDLAAAGTAMVNVFTAGPGGGTSSPQAFTIKNPAPTISMISPNSATVGSPAFTLTVVGSNFVPGSLVRWNGSGRPTTFVGNSQMRALIPASDIGSAMTVNITVFTPAPGGGTSPALPFTINNTAQASASNPAIGSPALGSPPEESQSSRAVTRSEGEPMNRPLVFVSAVGSMPVIESVSPASAAAGDGAFTLKVTGRNFVPNSVVRWGDKELSTRFVGRTELAAEVPAEAVTAPSKARVTVSNPGPATANDSKPFVFYVTERRPPRFQ